MKSDYDVLQELLLLVAETLKEHHEQLAKLNARLLVLRQAIASFHEHPEDCEEQLRRLEEGAQTVALSQSSFPQADAMLRMIKAGKKLSEPDS